jgi:hypothetical protein
MTGDVMAATANGDDELVFAGRLHGLLHVALGAATHDDRGLAVDHGIPDGPGFVVVGIARSSHVGSGFMVSVTSAR